MLLNNELVNKVKDFVKEAHKHQIRRGRENYHYHPLRVSEMAQRVAKKISPELQLKVAVVALLHDVIEDTSYTIYDIGNMFDIPCTWLETLDLLTKYKKEDGSLETHHENIKRIIDSGDLAALIIKRADATDNGTVVDGDIDWYIKFGYNFTADMIKYTNTVNICTLEIIQLLKAGEHLDA